MINSESILLKPHFYTLPITGLMILIIIILMIKNYKKLMKLPIATIILLTAITGNLIANHGNLHYILDREYGYNPLRATYKFLNI